MKLTVNRATLAQAVAQVSRVADPTGRIPGTQGMVWTADAQQNTLTLRATNLIVQTVATCAAEVTEGGSVTLSAATIPDLIRRFPADTVAIAPTEKGIRFQSGRSQATVQRLETEPAVLALTGDTTVTWSMDGSVWAQIAKRHLGMVSRDEHKHILRGVAMTLADQTVTFISTDGSRLARSRVALETPVAEALTVVLPSAMVQELSHLRGPVTLRVNAQLVVAEWEGGQLAARMIDGNYPDVDRVFPAAYVTTVSTSIPTARGALERMQVLTASQHSSSIEVHVAPDQFQMTSTAPEIGEGLEELEGSVDGEPLSLLFNAAYLVDALKPMTSDTVRFQFSGTQSPVRIHDPADASYEVIVLPLRKVV